MASAAPDLDGWALVERLLEDLATLDERLWLVVDDVHELGSTEVLRQLALLVMRAPAEMRFVLATRHDVQLGCTGCGWKAIWSRSAARTCASAWRGRATGNGRGEAARPSTAGAA